MTAPLASVVPLRPEQADFNWPRYKEAVMGRMLRDSGLRGSALRVGGLLLEYLNKDALMAWPGVETLAEALNTGPRQVRRALSELIERGHWYRARASIGGRHRQAGFRPCLATAETVTGESGNPDTSVPETVTPVSAHKEPHKEPDNQPHPADAPALAEPPEPVSGGEGSSIEDGEGSSPDELAGIIRRRFFVHRDDAATFAAAWSAALGREEACQEMAQLAVRVPGGRTPAERAEARALLLDHMRRLVHAAPGNPAAQDIAPEAPSRPGVPAELRTAWAAVQLRMRAETGSAQWRSWLAGLTLAGADGDTVRLLAPSAFVADWVKGRHMSQLRAHWHAVRPEFRHLLIVGPGKQ